jgi:hypothetical protein
MPNLCGTSHVDVHVRMVVNRFEIRDKTIHEAQRLNEILTLERS